MIMTYPDSKDRSFAFVDTDVTALGIEFITTMMFFSEISQSFKNRIFHPLPIPTAYVMFVK
jgi:hypothetical protein